MTTRRKVKPCTVNGYLRVAADLMKRTMNPVKLNTHEFASSNRVNSNFVSMMAKADIVRHVSRGTYMWQGPMPDYETMEALILGNYDKVVTHLPHVAGTGSTTPTQGTLDFAEPAANDEDRIAKLESRVASLEQLIIRRGIA